MTRGERRRVGPAVQNALEYGCSKLQLKSCASAVNNPSGEAFRAPSAQPCKGAMLITDTADRASLDNLAKMLSTFRARIHPGKHIYLQV